VYIHGAVNIGRDCRIGPFAFLREGTVIGDDVVLGVFTEVKNASLADGVRARHHSYLGDATIGRRVNVGAGSITANYDGHHVHQTSVGDDCNIGSGVVLIAPLVLTPGANVGAGKVVSQENVENICAKQ
jgi:bifunctional UDP-N-acetylglucosamine pyrophosphorylase/glucosamine-1-phosphate N-acetyltransferase